MNFMGPASLGLEIDIFGDFIYSVLLLNLILGLIFLRVSPIPTDAGSSGPGPSRAAHRAVRDRRDGVCQGGLHLHVCGYEAFFDDCARRWWHDPAPPITCDNASWKRCWLRGLAVDLPLDLARSALQAHPPWCEKQDERMASGSAILRSLCLGRRWGETALSWTLVHFVASWLGRGGSAANV